MTRKGSQACPLRYAPHSRCGIITSTDDKVPVNLQTTYARLVTDQHVLADALFDVPDAEGGIPGTRDCGFVVTHLEASNGRCVTTEDVFAFTEVQTRLARVNHHHNYHQ